jgi:hypothetical protein
MNTIDETVALIRRQTELELELLNGDAIAPKAERASGHAPPNCSPSARNYRHSAHRTSAQAQSRRRLCSRRGGLE